VKNEHPNWTSSTQSTKSSWFTKSAGTKGVSFVSAFTRHGLVVQLLFEDVDAELNAARYEAMLSKKDVMESAFGAPLVWEQLEGKKSTRISSLLDGYRDVVQTEQWDTWIEWLIATEERLRAAFAAAGGVPIA
jgi:hypothetical protein